MATTWLQQHVQNKSAPACPLELAVCGSASLTSRTDGSGARSIRHKYKWKQMLAPIPANNANAFARNIPFRFDSTMKDSERMHQPKIAAPEPADGFVPPRSPCPFPTLLWACGRKNKWKKHTHPGNKPIESGGTARGIT